MNFFFVAASELLLVDVLLKATVLLLLAAVACRLLRRGSAGLRHLVWVSTMSLLLVLPILCWGLPRWRVLPNWAAMERPVASADFTSTTLAPSDELLPPPALNVSSTAANVAAPPVVGPGETKSAIVAERPSSNYLAWTAIPDISFLLVVMFVWAAGASFMGALLLRGAWSLRIRSRTATEIRGGALSEALRRSACELRRSPPRLLLGERGEMPMAWGVFRPTVLLPADAEVWNAARLRTVLLHELAHLRRHDPLALLVAGVCRAVYWFHPLAWLVMRRLRDEQEQAADDLVLGVGVQPSEYAEHVLHFASRLRSSRHDEALALAMARSAKVERRVLAILDAARPRHELSWRAAILTTFAVVVIVGGLSMLHAADEPSTEPQQQDAPSQPDDQPREESKPTKPVKTDPDAPTVLGIDLSKLPVASQPAELPDLYQPVAGRPGRWASQEAIYVYRLPIDEPPGAWIKYLPARGRYYIEYRPHIDKPETERTYGPIEGDPFKQLELEERLIEELSSEPNGLANLSSHAGRMFRADDADMSTKAIRIMAAVLQKSSDLIAKDRYAGQIEAVLGEYQDVIQRQRLGMYAAQLRDQLEVVNKDVDALTVAFPDEDYSTADGATRKPPESIPRDAWGETEKGLRMAIVASPNSVRRGESLEVQLVIENAGDHDIKFPIVAANQDPNAEVHTPEGEEVRTSKVWYSGWPPTQRYLLKPGERVVISTLPMTVVDQKDAKGGRFGETKIIDAEDGGTRTFLVRYKVSLGAGSAWARGDDGVMRRVTPAKGEWSGYLNSGEIPIRRIK